MRVLPILFNTDMVRAILEERKSCTRRLVKARRKDACGFYVTKNSDGSFAGIYEYDENESMFDNQLMPPYQPGDILYVRETWEHIECHCCEGDEHGNCFQEPQKSVLCKSYGCYVYRATSEISGDARWHPSIHMPKEAARIWLQVTDVWVERLQDITPKDAKNEGVGNLFYEDIGYSGKDYGTEVDSEYGIAKEQFAWLWDSTIKKADLDCYGWDANPWVWVIEFERCEKPEESE